MYKRHPKNLISKKTIAPLIVKLIKLKHQSKKQAEGNALARSLDSIIHFLVTDERFQLYKNTSRDADIIWLYESSGEAESLIL